VAATSKWHQSSPYNSKSVPTASHPDVRREGVVVALRGHLAGAAPRTGVPGYPSAATRSILPEGRRYAQTRAVQDVASCHRGCTTSRFWALTIGVRWPRPLISHAKRLPPVMF
jgi:hypothetical protein